MVVARRDTAVVNLQCIGSDGRLPTPYCDKDGPLAGQFSVLSAVPLPHGFAKLLSLRVSDSSECMCHGLRCYWPPPLSMHCRPCLPLWGTLGFLWGELSDLLADTTWSGSPARSRCPTVCAMEPWNGISCSCKNTTKQRPLITRTHRCANCLFSSSLLQCKLPRLASCLRLTACLWGCTRCGATS